MQTNESRRSERLVALGVTAALALNYPILHMFDSSSLVLGIPILYFYLFVVWAVVIVCVGRVMRQGKPEHDSPH
ncbi:MAG: hypothetical protein OES09_11835 [Gammaproteobacteria bacterium]|nr:hypothetical protein [Gammaproteobacteria bacterium]